MDARAVKKQEPKPATRRQAQANSRREQLLAVALDHFAEQGVRGTSIRDIARAAGVTEGLIYHYFDDKAGLIRAVIERFTFAEEMAAQLSDAADLPAPEALYCIGKRLFALLSRNRKYVMMVTTQAQRDPQVARVLGQVMGRGFQPGLALIRKRIASGELRPHDPAITLRLLHGSLLWFFLTHEKLSPPLPKISANSFISGISEIVLNGIVAPKTRTQRKEKCR
jgi:AcrR family transcriptional regulator